MLADTTPDPEVIDPPDNTGGGNKTEQAASSNATTIDPPDNTGGGTTSEK